MQQCKGKAEKTDGKRQTLRKVLFVIPAK